MNSKFPLTSPVCRNCMYAEPAHTDGGKCLYGSTVFDPARCTKCGHRIHFLTEVCMPRTVPLPGDHQKCDEVSDELR